MHPNTRLLTDFYTAFQRGDIPAMVACYHPEVEFADPAFGTLRGPEVGAMWHMLWERSQGNLRVEFSGIAASAERGRAHWAAHYHFGKQRRPVHNKIDAEFTFQDGKIRTHRDRFSFWRWSQQALGPIGWALGWTPLLRNRVRQTSRSLLAKYQQDNAV